VAGFDLLQQSRFLGCHRDDITGVDRLRITAIGAFHVGRFVGLNRINFRCDFDADTALA